MTAADWLKEKLLILEGQAKAYREVATQLKAQEDAAAEATEEKKPKKGKAKAKKPRKAKPAEVEEPAEIEEDDPDMPTDEVMDEDTDVPIDGRDKIIEKIKRLDKNQEKLDEVTEGINGISMRQRNVLRSIKDDNHKQKEIAKDTGIASLTIHSCLQKLNKKGLVTRAGHGYYEITAKGKEVIENV